MRFQIGINQRIPMSSLADALLSILDGSYSDAYATELVRRDFSGPNRLKKAAQVLNKITRNNQLLPYVCENSSQVSAALGNPADRSLILVSLVNSAYAFCYDVTATLGRYFHAQPQVSSTLLRSKLSEKYGTNRSLPNGLYCILPMLIDAGFISRPAPGVYKMRRITPVSAIALDLYRRSFFVNNPLLESDYPAENNFYFEFIGD